MELTALYEESCEYDAAVQTLGRVEPANEQAHAALMRLHALSERLAEALATYGRLEEVLSREFGAKPGSATRRLREESSQPTRLWQPLQRGRNHGRLLSTTYPHQETASSGERGR